MKPFKIFKVPGYLYRSLKGDLRKLPKYKAPKSPKIAFCLFGLVGNIQGNSCNHETTVGAEKILEIGHKHYKEYIFDKNEQIDVFVHTWSVDLKDQIEKLYQPKKAIFQNQITFDIPDYVIGKPGTKHGQYSMSYGIKKVIELKSQFEKENNFKYDLVMLIRFDIAWQKNLIFNNFDPQYFYAAECFQPQPFLGLKFLRYGYPYEKEGLADFWFLSNSDYMDMYSTLFDNLNEYNKPGKCPISPNTGVTNHKLVSYHLKQKGLINKLRFVFEHLSSNEIDPLVRKKYFNSKI